MGVGKIIYCCMENKVGGNLIAMVEVCEQYTKNRAWKVRR